MVIQKIVRSGKFYKIITDHKDISLLSESTITDFKLFPDKEITDELIEEIKFKDLENYYYNRVIGLIARRPRSKNEIGQYLNSKTYREGIDSNKLKDLVTNRLVAAGYLNDYNFTKWWIDNRVRSQKKGPQFIFAELLQKGIDKGTIQSILSEVDEDKILESCRLLAEKKLNTIKASNKFERVQKLKKYLLGRGFNWKQIEKVTEVI